MSQGLLAYIAQRQAEAEAARIVGEALDAARAVLSQAGVEEPEEVLGAIWEADAG